MFIYLVYVNAVIIIGIFKMLTKLLITLPLYYIIYMDVSNGQTTVRNNRLLSRKRRYLLFPDGSNFVMTMSFSKSVMVEAPRGINVLGECDVPFKLPSDLQTFRTKKLHRQRREVYLQLQYGLDNFGVNGNACVKRIICDGQQYLSEKGKSLIGDLLATVFTFSMDQSLEDEEFHGYCNNGTYQNCKQPFFEYILGSLLS